jgi:hypothetical protein
MNFHLPRKILFCQSVIVAIGVLSGCSGDYKSQVEGLDGEVSLRIDLSNSEVTDDDLEGLGFPEITKEVLLENTGITDRGVEALSQFESIEFVDLTGTQITGNALEILMQFPNLQSANVLADNVEVKDIKAFQKFLREKTGGREGRRVIIPGPPYE